jgi:hypothetical protein
MGQLRKIRRGANVYLDEIAHGLSPNENKISCEEESNCATKQK